MATKEQLAAIKAFVDKRLEIAVDECAELLSVSMEDADAILAAIPEYAFTPKAYRGRTDFPNVYHAPLGPDPRDKADGTRDTGHVLAHNAHLGAFEGARAMGD